MSLLRSNCVSRWSRISKIAFAWISLSAELPHQADPGFIGRLRPPNQGDHRIQVIERNLEALEDMGTLFRLAELEGGPTDDDLAPVLDEMMQDLLEVQHFRPVVHQRQHDDPEGRLELRELIEIVQGDERNFAALEFDDDADAVPIGLRRADRKFP